MNETEIKINDKIYVLKDNVEETQCGVMDVANISLLLKIETKWIEGSTITISKPKLTFKENGTLDECSIDFGRSKILTKGGTKISYDVYKYCCMMVNGLFMEKTNKEIMFEVWEGWDKDNNQFKKDYPVLLKRGDYACILAPRVDNE